MNTKHTVIPGDPDDLYCDTCTNRYASRGTGYRTREGARVAGWHIHQEPNLDFKTLCPDCVGTPRTKAPVVQVMEGQEDMLERLAQDMNWVVEQVPKKIKKRGTSGREMS